MSVIPNLPNRTDPAERVEPVDRPPVAREDLAGPTSEQLEIRRRSRLAKWSQIISLLFVILEVGILFRIGLKLIAANPASPFAQFMYQMTGPFLAPFAGLTVTPAVNGSVLEIPAIVAMIAYGVLYLLIIRVMWVLFNPAKARDAAKYEPDL
jgi:uncharacterized protein YggT (Ycf19 family)